MSIIQTSLNLVNQVLVELGQQPVTAITQDPNAQKINTRLPQLTYDLLSQNNWNFATYRTQVQLTTAEVDNYYTKAYQLPADFLRLITIEDIIPYIVRQQYVCTPGDVSPLYIHYISSSTPWEALPWTFSEALALYVAMKMGPQLTQNATLQKNLNERFEIQYGKAVWYDKNENGYQEPPENRYDRIIAI